MAKDAATRYQTPAEVASALTPFATAKPPRKKWPFVAAAFGFFAALALGVIIHVQTDRGTIVIETNDDAVAVLIEKEGGVKIVDKVNNRAYTLKAGAQNAKPGEYKLDVTEPMAGLVFGTTEFELKRGAEIRVTAKLVPTVAVPTVSGKVAPPIKADFSPVNFQALTNQKLKAPLAGGAPEISWIFAPASIASWIYRSRSGRVSSKLEATDSSTDRQRLLASQSAKK